MYTNGNAFIMTSVFVPDIHEQSASPVPARVLPSPTIYRGAVRSIDFREYKSMAVATANYYRQTEGAASRNRLETATRISMSLSFI